MRLELPLNHRIDLCKSGPELPLLQRRPWATRAWNDQEKASAVKKSQVRVTPALDCTCKKIKNARETYIPPNSSGHSWIKVLEVSFNDYDNNKEFYEDKIQTARFFFQRVLPRIDTHCISAMSGSGYIMDFKFN